MLFRNLTLYDIGPLLFGYFTNSSPHSSLRKYTVIGSPEQRQRYKNDFNAEYSEYRGLHARIEGITRQFTVLDNELKQLQQGTDKYKVSFLSNTRAVFVRKYLV